MNSKEKNKNPNENISERKYCKTVPLKVLTTRMHSSRMHTACFCSSKGVGPGYVDPQEADHLETDPPEADLLETDPLYADPPDADLPEDRPSPRGRPAGGRPP